MMKASHWANASCDARVPTTPVPPATYGLSSGTESLPSSAFTITPPSFSASSSSSAP